jgi:PAS domain S-box-containing protein
MPDYLQGLKNGFMPDGFGLHGDPALLSVFIVANLAAALAYFAIAAGLGYFTSKRADLPYPQIFWLFAAFLLCACVARLAKMWTLYQGTYSWPQAVVDILTAGISLLTAVVLWPLIPRLLALRSPAEVEAANTRLEHELSMRKEAEQKFRGILEAAPDPIIIANERGTIVFSNSQATIALGYDREELLGHSIEILVPKRFRDDHPERVRNFFAAPRARHVGSGIEASAVRKDGTEFPVDIGLSPIQTGEGLLVTAVICDLTERKRDEKLRGELAAILESSVDAIVGKSLDGTITSWNQGAEQMFGYTANEVVGRSGTILVPQDRRHEHADNIERIKREEKIFIFETKRLRKDGSTIDVSLTISPVKNPAGQVIGAYKIVRDITKHKQNEAALKEQAEALARSNADLDQFATFASHDLQEPLRGVASCLQILEKKYKGSLDEKADELIHHSVKEATRMRQLIDDLLSLARVTSKGKAFEQVDLAKTINQAIDNLQTAIREGGATVTHDALPRVTAEETQLMQLFQNLIGNAIKFSKDKPPEVHIAVERKNSHWEFCVRDNGIGFAQEYAEQIFLPFKRLHARDVYAGTTAGSGTGIGLAICKKIVERHGGNIWAESELGNGARFYFTIPDLGNFAM